MTKQARAIRVPLSRLTLDAANDGPLAEYVTATRGLRLGLKEVPPITKSAAPFTPHRERRVTTAPIQVHHIGASQSPLRFETKKKLNGRMIFNSGRPKLDPRSYKGSAQDHSSKASPLLQRVPRRFQKGTGGKGRLFWQLYGTLGRGANLILRAADGSAGTELS